MPMIKQILLVLSIILSLPLMAQVKYEKEIRVSDKDVPKEALGLVEQLMPGQKVKWYKEFGKDKTSFEAKTKKDGKAYSIEFSEQGGFEDLEERVRFEALPETVKTAIRLVLDDTFAKYSIEKVQIQYSGSADELTLHFLQGTKSGSLVVRYEVIVAAKEDGQFNEFEWLFDAAGSILHRQIIMPKDTQNLEY